jgi:hypothetical protein
MYMPALVESFMKSLTIIVRPHRPELDSASSGKGADRKQRKKRKMGKTISEKKDRTAITKAET